MFYFSTRFLYHTPPLYADPNYLIGKTDGCKNNPENSSTKILDEHISSGVLVSTILSFKSSKNKHDVYRGKDCMKKFRKSLREHPVKTIDFKKKAMKLLTNE